MRETGAILFGTARRKILELLLVRGRCCYLREIVRESELSVGAVQKELKNLTEARILLREPKGKQVFYRANPDCPILPELTAIIRKTSTNMVRAEQIKTYRQMSATEKLEQAGLLHDQAWTLKAAGVRRAHPDWSAEEIEQEVKRIFMYAST